MKKQVGKARKYRRIRRTKRVHRRSLVKRASGKPQVAEIEPPDVLPFARFAKPAQGEFDLVSRIDRKSTHVKWNVGKEQSEVLFGETRRVALLSLDSESFKQHVGTIHESIYYPGVIKKWCRELIGAGFKQVWICSPQLHQKMWEILHESDLKESVVVIDEPLTADSAGDKLREIASLQLDNVLSEEARPEVFHYQKAVVPVRAQEVVRPNLAEPLHPLLGKDSDSVWEKTIKEYLDKRHVMNRKVRVQAVPVSNGKEVTFELDFLLEKGIVIQPHWEGYRWSEFLDQCLGLKHRFPHFKIVLVSNENQEALTGQFIDYWAGYSPPDFGGLTVILRELGIL